MRLTFLAFLVALVGLFVGAASLQPSHYDVTRITVINAPPQAVFEQVSNLRKWEAWSPWAKLDGPNRTVTFSGPEAGSNARMDWSGNSELGEGSIVITETHPPERVVFNLELVRPLKRTTTVEVLFTPQSNGAQTEVRWNAQGEKNLLAKVMGLLVNSDRITGEDIGKHLADMKSALETKAQAAPAPVVGPMPQPASAPSQAAAASKAQPTSGAASPAAISEAAPATKVTPSPPTSTTPAAADGAKVSVDVKKADPPGNN